MFLLAGVSCLRVCDCVPCRLKLFFFGGRRVRGVFDKYEGTGCHQARLLMHDAYVLAQADKGARLRGEERVSHGVCWRIALRLRSRSLGIIWPPGRTLAVGC